MAAREPPESSKNCFGMFLQNFQEFCGNGGILVNLAKRGPLGGPAPRSLFFLRNIKVSEPPEYGKLVRNCDFHEISWHFMKFHEISWFLRNFHVCRGFSPFFCFWSVSGPPGRLKNISIPIGITRFSACGGQGTTRILQKLLLACFCRISRNSAEMVKFWST